MRNHKEYRNPRLKARLSFDEGYAENPIYSIKASNTEKQKGFEMIDLIMANFSITLSEIKVFIEEKREEIAREIRAFAKTQPKINWSRDERGNLVSPFRSKRKIS